MGEYMCVVSFSPSGSRFLDRKSEIEINRVREAREMDGWMDGWMVRAACHLLSSRDESGEKHISLIGIDWTCPKRLFIKTPL